MLYIGYMDNIVYINDYIKQMINKKTKLTNKTLIEYTIFVNMLNFEQLKQFKKLEKAEKELNIYG